MVRTRKKRTSIRDVAAMAEVSIATVSRVLNNDKEDVSEQLRNRVLDSCKRLSYRLNPGIQDLVRSSRYGKTKNIAYVYVGIDHFSNPSNAESIEGVARANGESNYFLSLVQLSGSEKSVYDLPPILRDSRIDGMLITGHLDYEIMQVLKEVSVPFVILGCYGELVSDDVNSVQLDIESTVLKLVRKLKECGRRKIGNVSNSRGNYYAERFSSAVKLALDQCQMEYEESRMYVCGDHPGGSDGLIADIFSQNVLPFDGIICEDYSNAMKLVYQAGVHCAMSCATDVLLVATSYFRSHCLLPATTVYFECPSYQQGYRGMKMLIDALNNRNTTTIGNLQVPTNVFLK